MHLLRTTPGGFVDDAAGVMRIEQTPAPIVVLSSADTTLSLLASVVPRLEAGFPAVRLANQSFLRQPASVDFYVDDVLRHARVVVVDHLGGESYWPYGIERIVSLARRESADARDVFRRPAGRPEPHREEHGGPGALPRAVALSARRRRAERRGVPAVHRSIARSAGGARRARRVRCPRSRSIIRRAKSRPSTTGARAGRQARRSARSCSLSRAPAVGQYRRVRRAHRALERRGAQSAAASRWPR